MQACVNLRIRLYVVTAVSIDGHMLSVNNCHMRRKSTMNAKITLEFRFSMPLFARREARSHGAVEPKRCAAVLLTADISDRKLLNSPPNTANVRLRRASTIGIISLFS